jgi:hypothetical protein
MMPRPISSLARSGRRWCLYQQEASYEVSDTSWYHVDRGGHVGTVEDTCHSGIRGHSEPNRIRVVLFRPIGTPMTTFAVSMS